MREQPRPRYALEEMGGWLRALTCEQRGLVNDFRDYAWCNFGLPSDDRELERLAQTFGLSRYKFRKLWPELKKFFTELAGRLVYTPDEESSAELAEPTVKVTDKSEHARIAARSRWSRRVSDNGMLNSEHRPEHDRASNEHPSPRGFPSHSPSFPPESSRNTAASEKTTGIVALSTAVADADKRKPPQSEPIPGFDEARKLILTCKRFSDVTPQFFRNLIEVSREADPSLTDETLCRALRATYKGDRQESPGLWLVTVPAWLRNQTLRVMA